MKLFNQEITTLTATFSTIRDIIRFMVSTFNEHELYYGHGTTNAFDEAVYLTLATLHLPIDDINPYWDAKLLPSEIQTLITVCKKRAIDKMPAPYITGKSYFMGYEFYVHNTLDLCTGNGSLAIIAADYFYESHVVASDIDKNALTVAKTNIQKHGLEDRITTVSSDLFNKLNKYKNTFDLIITNPPYVDTEIMSTLPKEYLHEPHISLDGGADGLLLIDSILKNARDYLAPFGVLVVEMGNNQQELINKYSELNITWLDTSNNEGFVFVVTKQDLDQYYS
jgi:ribosomal protein L3 glutamine methyltransferase